MISGLGTQTREFLMAGFLGLGLGLCYDWGRAHRRIFPKLTLPVDMLFALLFFLVLMLMSIYTRGLKLYQLLGLGLGGSLYFLLLSRVLLRLGLVLLMKIRGILGAMKKQTKKFPNFLRKFEKKLFPSSTKWGTMDMMPFLPKRKHKRQKGADSGDKRCSIQGRSRNDGGMGRMEFGKSGRHAPGRNRPGAGIGKSRG